MSNKTKARDGKIFWKSKTFWVNVIGLVVVAVQYFTGWVIPAVAQSAALAIINLILRATTHEKIYWKGIKMLMIPFMVVGFMGLTAQSGCVHDSALRRPVLLITCEYEGYVKADTKLKPESKKIRLHTAKLLRDQVQAGPCGGGE